VVFALRDIQENEEICFSYFGDPDDDDDDNGKETGAVSN
jgi:SET domain-containing protein